MPALSLYHFFDWRWVSFSSFRGWMVSVATFTNALLAAVYLRLIVSGGSLGPCWCGWLGCRSCLCILCAACEWPLIDWLSDRACDSMSCLNCTVLHVACCR